MIYLILAAVFFSVLQGTVDAKNVGENIRQIIIGLLDGKDGVHCDEFTDKQCPKDQVTFWLYTQEGRDNPHNFNPSDDASIRDAPFVRDAPVKILIHGYTMNKDKAINEVLGPAYFKVSRFKNDNINIISVDWSEISKDHCYKQAANSIPTVGTCVAQFLKQVQNLRSDLGQMHMLGHSMGAHVVAWASLDLDLPRVTQFDPALPLFSDSDKDLFRRPKATMVDVWHSNSGLKGREDASGTVDLYFNDEMDQPGCSCDTSCSHLRAVQYYGETVSEKTPINAFSCKGFEEYAGDSCNMPAPQDLADFGETFTDGVNGPYLTFTNANPPYIIRGEDFTNRDTFQNFKKTHDTNCPQHNFFNIVGEIVIGG